MHDYTRSPRLSNEAMILGQNCGVYQKIKPTMYKKNPFFAKKKRVRKKTRFRAEKNPTKKNQFSTKGPPAFLPKKSPRDKKVYPKKAIL